MKKINIWILCVILINICSCSNDNEANEQIEEDSNNPPVELTLSELRTESTLILTSGTIKTWRINEATLISDNNTIDISSNFNVVDDEFIFSGTGESGAIAWVRGFDIQTNASNSNETLIDFYMSPIETTFNYQSESSTVIEADFGTCTFVINDDGSLSASIVNEDNSVFNFTLLEKTSEDFLAVPETGLNFTQAFTFESNFIEFNHSGMIGSYSNNSFFVVTREDDLNNLPERILTFDIENNTISENLFFEGGFLSKQPHVIGDKLFVVGGLSINEYNVNMLGDPVSTSHGKMLSRFGTAVLNNDIYIVGGDTNQDDADKVFRWNIDTQILEEFATLPERRFNARATIVNNNLYIFGGTTTLSGQNPSSLIYKINLEAPSQIDSFLINKDVHITYVHSYQNLIYLAGKIRIPVNNTTFIESTVGIFNTLDNTYQELDTNLVNESGFDGIQQMCIVNNKMYILYGDFGVDNGGELDEWEVLVSDLN